MHIRSWTLVGALGLAAIGAIGFGAARGSSCCATAAAHENVSALGTGSPAAVAGSSTATLSIDGMSCASCAFGVRKALSSISGVTDVKMIEKGAVVHYDPTKSTTAQMVDAVNKLGYKTTVASDVKS